MNLSFLQISLLILVIGYFVWMVFDKPNSRAEKLRNVIYGIIILLMLSATFVSQSLHDLLLALAFLLLTSTQLSQIYYPSRIITKSQKKKNFRKWLLWILTFIFLGLTIYAGIHVFNAGSV